jgi:uncharacterized protein YgiM (DUF1202 family)
LDTVTELVGFLGPDLLDKGEATEEVQLTPTATPTTPSDIEWVFIRFNPPEGGSITGWVSTTYVQYEWNGAGIDPEELLARELVELIDPDTRGEISGGAQQASVPTPDPLEDAYVAEVILDAGANLQFRRNPNAQSESLNLIPSGTQLIIDARDATSEWLQTTFEGETGWISSQFVTLTFNGELVDIETIPVAPGPEAESTETSEATEEASNSG